MVNKIQADKEFSFKKAQIEQYLRSQYDKKFPGKSKVSIRQRKKFMKSVTREIGERFGKDVLCLMDFGKGGFASLISPSHTESTNKGKLYQSFSHPQVYYTSHCIDRFSQRTKTGDNCVIALDNYLTDAMLTFGIHEAHLVGTDGVFAYVLEEDRMVIKTFINFDLLSDKQILEFYGPGIENLLDDNMISGSASESDFILVDEIPHPTDNLKNS